MNVFILHSSIFKMRDELELELEVEVGPLVRYSYIAIIIYSYVGGYFRRGMKREESRVSFHRRWC